MIKFKGSHNGKPLLGFGLSAGNIKLLQQDRPMLFNLAEMGAGDVYVMIIYGETEAKIFRKLKQSGAVDSQSKIIPVSGLRVVDHDGVDQLLLPDHFTLEDIEQALKEYQAKKGRHHL